MGIILSPIEITVVRLGGMQRRREAQVSSVNNAGEKSGVMDKDQRAFDREMLSPGLLKGTLRADLAPGQYGFIQSMSGGGSQCALTARVFDFGMEQGCGSRSAMPRSRPVPFRRHSSDSWDLPPMGKRKAGKCQLWLASRGEGQCR